MLSWQHRSRLNEPRTPSRFAPLTLPRIAARGAILVFGLALFPLATPIAAQATDDSLLARWAMDDTDPQQALDSSGNQRHGTRQGGIASASPGMIDDALFFDGTDDYIKIADDPGLDVVAGLTIALWLRPAALTNSTTLVSKDGAYELDFNRAGARVYSLRLGNAQRGRGLTPLTLDAWQHVAVTWDGITVRYYYQGNADGTGQCTGPLPNNTNDLGLGGRPPSFLSGIAQMLFSGGLDDVRLYNRALSAAEVAAIFQNQGTTSPASDLEPPARSSGSPNGTLDFDQTSAMLVLVTNESAQCRYHSSPGVDFALMEDVFDISGGAFHSQELTGLTAGESYVVYVRCADTSGNVNDDDFTITFDVAGGPPMDDDPPELSSPTPVGTLPPGTDHIDLGVVTDEDAECRYAEVPGTPFDSMGQVFQLTGGREHSSVVTDGVVDGSHRAFFVRCRDTSGNESQQDLAIGVWLAEPAPGNGFHPTDLPGLELYVESRAGLSVATCGTETCRQAGENVTLEDQYCDTDTFPFGCVRRWQDQSTFFPSQPFEPPEWIAGRDFGQDDLDKPGFIPNCVNGRPCVRGGVGETQLRGFEIEPNQPVGPMTGPFSFYVLAKPISQVDDYYYAGFAGSELIHVVNENSLFLRLGFGPKIRLTDRRSVDLNRWQLIEVHRDAADRLTTLVNGYDVSRQHVSATADFWFRFLMTVSRGRAFLGDMAATMVVRGALPEADRQQVRDYFADVYALPMGDGGPKPEPALPIPAAGLVAHWSFDDGIADCVASNDAGSAPDALVGGGCPGDGPSEEAGRSSTALVFDGVNDHLSVAGPSALDGQSTITFAAWVKSEGNGTEFQSLIDKRDGAIDGFDLYLTPEGLPFMRVNDRAVRGSGNLLDGQWHHVAGTYDGSAMLLYVDGRLNAGRFAAGQILDTQAELQLGRGYIQGRNLLRGSLDQVRIYDRALGHQEIEALAAER